jgi:hypothetical protein
LRSFFVNPKKSALQHTRYEAFTKGAKTGRLSDSGVFGLDSEFAHFRRNSLKVSQMEFQSPRRQKRQNLVTYNNKPLAKPEKRWPFAWASFLMFLGFQT